MGRKKVDTGRWGDEPLRLVNEELAHAFTSLRPCGPDTVAAAEPARFEPDPAFERWIRENFIDAAGPLANQAHAHLVDATIGVLWTNCVNVSKQRHVLATAEIPQTMGSAWKKGRAEQQLRDWFEAEVDFVLTFYAPGMEEMDNRSFCAVVEHELFHCAQAVDQYGAPRFDRMTGKPVYAIRGHDVEEFTGVVERYGATSADVRRMVTAANARPSITDAPIDIACGTCARSRAAA